MPAVSNTSPVLNLALIDKLALLGDRFGEIWVPPAVLRELLLAFGSYPLALACLP